MSAKIINFISLRFANFYLWIPTISINMHATYDMLHDMFDTSENKIDQRNNVHIPEQLKILDDILNREAAKKRS